MCFQILKHFFRLWLALTSLAHYISHTRLHLEPRRPKKSQYSMHLLFTFSSCFPVDSVFYNPFPFVSLLNSEYILYNSGLDSVYLTNAAAVLSTHRAGDNANVEKEPIIPIVLTWHISIQIITCIVKCAVWGLCFLLLIDCTPTGKHRHRTLSSIQIILFFSIGTCYLKWISLIHSVNSLLNVILCKYCMFTVLYIHTVYCSKSESHRL